MNKRQVMPILLLCASALMVTLGLTGIWNAHDLRSNDAAQDLALVDADATSRVQAEVSQALVQILSYDYAAPESTAAAAGKLLAGDAKAQYATLFSTLEQKAAEQKLRLSATVTVSAVSSLTSTDAELLVFLDQSSKRAKDSQARLAAAQISVKAHKRDGRWLITALNPL